MGWYLRKSVKLFGGVRLNLSKSGVGLSAGIRGMRVSTGPRGSFIHMGAGGIYYRQRIGPTARAGTNPHSPYAPGTDNAASDACDPGNIRTAPVGNLVDSTSAEMLARLNASVSAPVYAHIVCWAGGIVAAASGAAIHPVMALLIGGLTAYLGWLTRGFDRERRQFSISYNVEARTDHRFAEVSQAAHSLSGSATLWRVDARSASTNLKQSAGAAWQYRRHSAACVRRALPWVVCDITPWCLDTGGQALFFLPDRVYVWDGRTYGAVEYAGLVAEVASLQFVETERVPCDGQIISYTWEHPNRDGSPDRRFSQNRQLPVCEYGQLVLRSSSGLCVVLLASALARAVEFSTRLMGIRVARERSQPHATARADRQDQHRTPPPCGSGSHSARQDPPRQPRDAREQAQRPPSPSSPSDVLGITPGCTREQAAQRYREIVMQNHPDRVAQMAPEFRALAERRMREINAAYERLRQERGWT